MFLAIMQFSMHHLFFKRRDFFAANFDKCKNKKKDIRSLMTTKQFQCFCFIRIEDVKKNFWTMSGWLGAFVDLDLFPVCPVGSVANSLAGQNQACLAAYTTCRQYKEGDGDGEKYHC